MIFSKHENKSGYQQVTMHSAKKLDTGCHNESTRERAEHKSNTTTLNPTKT